jgi:hypothetical protein
MVARLASGSPPPGLAGRRPSSYGVTVVFSESELFALFGSGGDVAATVAVFVIVPFCVGFTLIVTVTVAPAAMLPRVHVTSRFAGLTVHVPCVVVADPNPAFFGNVSFNVTPEATSGPSFVTRTV